MTIIVLAFKMREVMLQVLPCPTSLKWCGKAKKPQNAEFYPFLAESHLPILLFDIARFLSFLVGMGFELRASLLQSRYSTA
jgi:hypothetical protein